MTHVIVLFIYVLLYLYFCYIFKFLFTSGSVLDIIKHMKRSAQVDPLQGVLDEVVIATILREVLKGLEYFHKNGQIHRFVLFNVLFSFQFMSQDILFHSNLKKGLYSFQ